MNIETNQEVALLYVRVSTGKQAKSGHSLGSQETLLRSAAKRDGYEVEIVTETGSGRRSARPALQKALRRLQSGEAQALYALDIDRLARSTLHLLDIANLSQEQGWRLVITSADVDTSSPAGEMFFTMAAAFAQYESRMISQRVLRQHEARRERGAIWGVTEGPKSPLADDIVNLIIDLENSGMKASGISRRLTELGVPTARGGKWHPATVTGILNSPRVKMRKLEIAA